MTREQYIRMTEATRRVADRLPGREKALRAPTLLCAAIYCASLLYLMFTGDGRIVRAVLVPAACFAVVTALRSTGAQRRRMLDLGFVPGSCVRALHVSPWSDPVAYGVRGAVIARLDFGPVRGDTRCAHSSCAQKRCRTGRYRLSYADPVGRCAAAGLGRDKTGRSRRR